MSTIHDYYKPQSYLINEVNTSRSGEDSIKHQDDLTDVVPPISHDSPLLEGHTPRSDKEEAKTTHDKVITRLKLRVKRLKKKRKARTSQPINMRLFKGRVKTSTYKSLGKDASKQGRNDDKIEELNLTDGADTKVLVEDNGSGEKTLIKLRSKKEKKKGVAFRDVEEPPRLTRSTITLQPLLTVDPKDKEFDEIQARMDADHELAVRMTHEEQEKYTIKESARLLAEYFIKRKKQLVAKRAEAKRNQPPTRTQVRNTMITYLKHIDDFIPMDSKKEEKKSVETESKGKKGKRIKRVADSTLKQKSSKKQKMMHEQESAKSDEEESADYEHEKEELRTWEVPSFDKPKPQPQALPNCPPLDASLGTQRGLKPPIKPQSPNSFRMKVLDNLTIQTPPLSLVASFHLRDMYCYYRLCIDDPKKHYGFKPGLLRHSGSLGVNFSKLEMIDDDWGLESKEVYFLGRALNSPIWPKEVEKVIFDEKNHPNRVSAQPKVPDESKDKTTSTNEGISTKLGVLDVPKDQYKSENVSWGNSEDDDRHNDDGDDDDVDSDAGGDIEASDSEKTNYDKDEIPNLNQNKDEDEEDYVHTPNSFKFTKDDEEYEELYKDVNMRSYTIEFEKKAKDERKRYIGHVEKSVKDIIKDEVKAKSSSQLKSTYVAAVSLTEFELKKILLYKMQKSKLYRATQEHKDIYDALVKSYKLYKDLFESYGKLYSLKRDHEDKDKNEDHSTVSNQRLKKQKTSKDVEPSKGFKSKESKSSSSNGIKSQSKSFAFNMLKGTCRSRVELEYHFKECYKDVIDRLDWNNLKGQEYPFDLSKPLSLIEDQGRQVVTVNYFINNNLEYLKGGSSSRKYTNSTTKTKAAKYDDIQGIEDMVPSL
uniref:Uncharacterized protein n=1 Tax=Tanacetum cinerariifolium TaxID=118510 RepID=A0A6L2LC34_TANCI|nr:hypothetical protein [Tanacetum cinerariifolium]